MMRKISLNEFANEKKSYLTKLDKSKKGDIDEKIIPLLKRINLDNDLYTTSSCSGRVMLWSGSGKKNETEWIKVSHELIDREFLEVKTSEMETLEVRTLRVENAGKLVWLRVEPFILHVCCRNLEAAEKFLETVRKVYKKSCLLSTSNKVIVEVRGSEFIEMPLYENGETLLNRSLEWLVEMVNKKMVRIWAGMEKMEKSMKS
jgi:tRNA wybutosine-synthesizing protein 3